MPSFRALSTVEEQELDTCLVHALELVPVDPSQQGEGFLVVGIHVFVEAVRAGEELPPGVSPEDAATWMGVLWGEELARQGGWEWCSLRMDNGLEGVALVDRNRSRACYPLHCLHRWLSGDAESDVMPLFVRLCREEPGSDNALLLVG